MQRLQLLPSTLLALQRRLRGALHARRFILARQQPLSSRLFSSSAVQMAITSKPQPLARPRV
jgi:hypothetical protein